MTNIYSEQRIYSREATFAVSVLWWTRHLHSLSNTQLTTTTVDLHVHIEHRRAAGVNVYLLPLAIFKLRKTCKLNCITIN